MELKLHWHYFLGVGIGLAIAWVTGGLAYLIAGNAALPKLIVLELIVSVLAFIFAYLIKRSKG